MKTMSAKPNHEQAIKDFLARGGKIQKIETKTKPSKTRKVDVVEIDIEALPKELRRLIA